MLHPEDGDSRIMKLSYLCCTNLDAVAAHPFILILVSTFQNTNLVHILLIFNNISHITLLNMFRTARCSSSGGPIVSPQPLVSSPSVSSRTVCRLRADCSLLSTRILYGCLQRATIPEAVVIQLVLLDAARNMLRSVM